jgi:lipopolysaccharide transport system permease protein
VILQPLAYTLVFTGFFQLLGQHPTDETDVPYPLMALSGAILWQAFAQGVQQSTLCLANNRQLITKTFFPRLLLPIAAVSTPLIDFAIGWCLLLIASLSYGVTPGAWFLATPLLALPLTIVSFTIGTWVSMLNALYRDVSSLVPLALQIGFISTPVIFQTTVLIPDRFRTFAALNPLVTIIDAFRAAWFGQPLPTLPMIAVSAVSTAVVLVTGLRFFAKTEDIVADRV